MQLSKTESNKFRVFSIVAIIAVLYLHSKLECVQSSYIDVIQLLINNSARFAVPYFFVSSGYFFFLSKGQDFNINTRIRKRFKSILIPYVIWCFVFIVTIYFFSLIVPLNTDYFELLRSGKYLEFVGFIFWKPAAFHLWFIRDLFLLVIASPIIRYFIRQIPIIFIIGIAAIGSVFYENNEICSVLFFSIGAYYAIKDKPLFYNFKTSLSIVFLTVSMAVILYFSCIHKSVEYNMFKYIILTSYAIGLWNCSDLIFQRYSNRFLIKLANYSFLIYCAHIPLLVIIRIMLYPRVLSGDVGCLVTTVITPMISLLIIVPLFSFVRNLAPRFYKIISGGR